MSDLRDHGQPCKHKLDSGWDAAYQSDGVWLCRACPGGRQVTIDHEAGIEAWWQAFRTAGQYNPATRAAMNAAIGDTG